MQPHVLQRLELHARSSADSMNASEQLRWEQDAEVSIIYACICIYANSIVKERKRAAACVYRI
jgi:hypothetical protein